MKDSNDDDAVIGLDVEDQVAANRIPLVAGTNLIAFLPSSRASSNSLESDLDLGHVSLSLLLVPSFGREVPDL